MNGIVAAREGLVRVGEVVAPRAIYSRINICSVLLAIPTVLAPVMLVGMGVLTGTRSDLFRIVLPCLILILPLHEAIHYLTALVMGVPARECRLGVYWRKAMPYFRTLAPVPIGRYRLILLAPGMVLFAALMGPAVATRNFAWLILAGMALVSSSGDLYWFWRLRPIPDDRWVQDRAGLVGLDILEPPR